LRPLQSPLHQPIPCKDEEVIHIDDEAENVVDSGKAVSFSMYAADVPVKTTTKARANDAPKNMELAHGTPATHPQFFSILRKAPDEI
jgi:FMN phosphatase YigB (HAD superfamily)